jgi:hypothetical protein
MRRWTQISVVSCSLARPRAVSGYLRFEEWERETDRETTALHFPPYLLENESQCQLHTSAFLGLFHSWPSSFQERDPMS